MQRLGVNLIERSLWAGLIILGVVLLLTDQSIVPGAFTALTGAYLQTQAVFNLIGDFAGDWTIFLPCAFILTAAIIGIFLYPAPPPKLQAWIVLATILTHTIYVVFRTTNTIKIETPGITLASIFLWLAEVVFYFCSIFLYMQLLWPIDRRRHADDHQKQIISGEYSPSVDVYIATHSEPLEMVKRTATACQNLDYPHKTVYILDDGNRAAIRQLAQELNCQYLARGHNTHAKAGNINHALRHTHGEFIAMFDADCIPMKNFLTRTVGFFQDIEVALVITAQTFFNLKDFAHNSMSLMEGSSFFRHTQMGRDRFNALLCFGTCFVVRRTAMEDIGGMPHETLSEDWATSIKLQARGYKTYFLNEVLGAGAVAESMTEFANQRIRWTQGTLQALFSSTNPLRIPGLTLAQRVIHTYGILHYLLNPFNVIVILLPLIYFLCGFSPFEVTRGQFWIIFMPFFLTGTITFSWICREYTSKISSLISESFLSITLSHVVLKTLVKPFGWKFRVTKKDLYRTRPVFNPVVGLPIVILLTAIAAAAVYGFTQRHWFPSPEHFYFLFFIASARILLMIIGLYASFDLPQQRRQVRFPLEEDCVIYTDGIYQAKSIDLSEGGARIKPLDARAFPPAQSKVLISLPAAGVTNIAADILRRERSGRIALKFGALSMEQYRKLIDFLYCHPERWEGSARLDRQVLRSLLDAFRFRPLPKQTRVSAFVMILLAGSLLLNANPALAQTSPDPDLPDLPHYAINDARLDKLISAMYQNNAEAGKIIAVIRRLTYTSEQIKAQHSAQAQITALTGTSGGRSLETNPLWDNWISVPVSYEIDAWGRLSSRESAADMAVSAAEYELQALKSTITAELLDHYYLLITLENRISLLNAARANIIEACKLMHLRLQAGLEDEEKINAFRIEIGDIDGMIDQSKAQKMSALNAIMVLTGLTSDKIITGQPLALPEEITAFKGPLTDRMLESRPDLRAINEQIESAGYSIDEIRAESMPMITVNGDIHTGSDKTQNVLNSGNHGWGAFLKVTVPIFNRSANSAAYSVKRSERQALTREYQQQLLTARAEALEAAELRRHMQKELNILSRQYARHNRQYNIAKARFSAGLTDAIALNLAARQLAVKSTEIIEAKRKNIAAQVQLLRAAGVTIR